MFHITPGNRPHVATEVEVVESVLLTFIGEGPAFAGEDVMGDDAEFVAYWWSQLVVSLQEARSGRSVDASSRSSTTGSAGSTSRTMPGDRGTFIDEDDLDLQEDERRLADIMERVWSTRSPTRADVHHVLDSQEVLDQACQLAEAPECEDADRHQKALRAAAALQRDENDTMARAMTTSVHWQMPHDEVRVTSSPTPPGRLPAVGRQCNGICVQEKGYNFVWGWNNDGYHHRVPMTQRQGKGNDREG